MVKLPSMVIQLYGPTSDKVYLFYNPIEANENFLGIKFAHEILINGVTLDGNYAFAPIYWAATHYFLALHSSIALK